MNNKNVEIEKKFLISEKNEFIHNILTLYPSELYIQGYILNSEDKTVRIRIIENKECFITIKSGGNMKRFEFEYAIPEKDGKMMIDLFCKEVIKKIRTKIPFKGHNWEIDVFLEDNDGLIVAEIELDSEDEIFEKPKWIGEEVTEDPKYLNSNLIKNPYKNWK